MTLIESLTLIALLFKVLLWLLACHHRNYVVIIYLLEDEQELSLGMLIRVTPQKWGYRFLCCYSFLAFSADLFPLESGFRPEESRQSLTLQPFSLPLCKARSRPSPSSRDMQGYCRVRCNVLHISLISLMPIDGIKSRKITRHLKRLYKLVEMIWVIPLT